MASVDDGSTPRSGGHGVDRAAEGRDHQDVAEHAPGPGCRRPGSTAPSTVTPSAPRTVRHDGPRPGGARARGGAERVARARCAPHPGAVPAAPPPRTAGARVGPGTLPRLRAGEWADARPPQRRRALVLDGGLSTALEQQGADLPERCGPRGCWARSPSGSPRRTGPFFEAGRAGARRRRATRPASRAWSRRGTTPPRPGA